MALAISCLLKVALWQVITVTNNVMKIYFIKDPRIDKHYVCEQIQGKDLHLSQIFCTRGL